MGGAGARGGPTVRHRDGGADPVEHGDVVVGVAEAERIVAGDVEVGGEGGEAGSFGDAGLGELEEVAVRTGFVRGHRGNRRVGGEGGEFFRFPDPDDFEGGRGEEFCGGN